MARSCQVPVGHVLPPSATKCHWHSPGRKDAAGSTVLGTDPSAVTHCPSLLPADIKMGKKTTKKTCFRRNFPFPILEKSQFQASRQTF